MWVTKVTPRGGALTTSVPRALCRELGIERGDMLMFSLREHGVIEVQRVTREALEQLRPTKPNERVPHA